MMKGTVRAGMATTNQFAMLIPGLPVIYFTRVGEITSELVVAELADGTMQTTGRIKPGELEVDQYMHHADERVAMEAWFQACAIGAPGHKRDAEVYFNGADNQPIHAQMLMGVINKGRKTPELSAGEDGEGVVITWTLSFDDVVAL